MGLWDKPGYVTAHNRELGVGPKEYLSLCIRREKISIKPGYFYYEK